MIVRVCFIFPSCGWTLLNGCGYLSLEDTLFSRGKTTTTFECFGVLYCTYTINEGRKRLCKIKDSYRYGWRVVSRTPSLCLRLRIFVDGKLARKTLTSRKLLSQLLLFRLKWLVILFCSYQTVKRDSRSHFQVWLDRRRDLQLCTTIYSVISQ